MFLFLRFLEKFLFGAGTVKTEATKTEEAKIPDDKFGQALWGDDYSSTPARKPAWEDKSDQTT